MRNNRNLIKNLTLVVLLGLIAAVVWKHTALADWFKLRGYQPPVEISKLAAADTMTPAAQHLYYINHPKLITTSAQFGKVCPQLEHTIVLGCYHSMQRGIYLRSVSDTRLTGVEEVTAAHEMLHGAYERLSTKEKNYINSLLEDYYKNEVKDQRLIDTINAYKQSEPDSVVDEMHSIFGTEVANLPAPLENYYKRYFFNRTAVSSFASGYEAEFTSRLDQVKAYENQLSNLKEQINSEEAALESEAAKIESDRSNLESLRSNGLLTQYNERVAGFNGEVEIYNNGVAKLKADINTYNSIVVAHNQLADEISSLYSSLGTTLDQQTSQ